MNITDSNGKAGQSARDASVRGKVIVLTGASSGLGLETAKQLTLKGAAADPILAAKVWS